MRILLNYPKYLTSSRVFHQFTLADPLPRYGGKKSLPPSKWENFGNFWVHDKKKELKTFINFRRRPLPPRCSGFVTVSEINEIFAQMEGQFDFLTEKEIY